MKQVLSRRNLTFGGISSLATLALLGKYNKTQAAAPEHPNVTDYFHLSELKSFCN